MTSVLRHRMIHKRLFNPQLFKQRDLCLAQRLYAEDKTDATAVTATDNVSDEDKESTEKKGIFERMKASNYKKATESSGFFVVPTKWDKVALMWSGKYASRDDIPDVIVPSQQVAADNYVRVIILLWIMITYTLASFTMIFCGQQRTKKSLVEVTRRQNQIWQDRMEMEDLEKAEAAKKKK